MRTFLIRQIALNIWHVSELLKLSVLEDSFISVKCKCCVFLHLLLKVSWLKNQDRIKEIQSCMMLVLDSLIRSYVL